MCNKMHVPTRSLVTEVILQHVGEKHSVDEWSNMINNELPSPKRCGRRSMCQLIYGISRQNNIEVKVNRQCYTRSLELVEVKSI